MPAAGDALREALDLFDTGVELMRQNLRRRDPQATVDQIEARLIAWIRTRPGAEAGDGPRGRVRASPHAQ